MCCVVYGVANHPPAYAYISPGEAVSGRSALQGFVPTELFAGPSFSIYRKTKRVAGSRTTVQVSETASVPSRVWLRIGLPAVQDSVPAAWRPILQFYCF